MKLSKIARITLTTFGYPESHEGDMFDGTIEHRQDYFSNFSVQAAIDFAKSEGVDARQKAEAQNAELTILSEPVSPTSPGALAAAPDPSTLDWPDLDTVPSQLMGGDGCPWKQSNFL